MKLSSYLFQREINIRREAKWMKQWDFPLAQGLDLTYIFSVKPRGGERTKTERVRLLGVRKRNSQYLSSSWESFLSPFSEPTISSVLSKNKAPSNDWLDTGTQSMDSNWPHYQWVGLLCYVRLPGLGGSSPSFSFHGLNGQAEAGNSHYNRLGHPVFLFAFSQLHVASCSKNLWISGQ